jgi:Helix-hairpin-helix domain
MEEPSEEEDAKMDHLEAVAKGEVAEIATNDVNLTAIVREATSQHKQSQQDIRWDLSNREGLRSATEDILRFLSTPSNKKQHKNVNIPNDHSVAMQKIGQIISSNRTKDLDEVLVLIIQELGYKEDKESKENAKKQMISNAVGNSKNAPLVAAFQELAELYFKTGNANAGASYTKVVKALVDIPYEITAENAKGLAKGKTKVNNIGKSSGKFVLQKFAAGI